MNAIATAPKANVSESKRAISQNSNDQISAPNSEQPMRSASCACGGGCPGCHKNNLQPLSTNNAGTPQISHQTQKGLRSSASPLKSETQEMMESRFRYDFSAVRIHADSEAAASAKSLNARAYTVGRDIVFNNNQYSPHTYSGQTLLVHELAHVIQQNRGGYVPGPLIESPLEQYADAAASAFNSGTGIIQVAGASSPGLSRYPMSLSRLVNPRSMLDEELRLELYEIREWMSLQIEGGADYARLELVLANIEAELLRRGSAPTTFSQALRQLELASQHATHEPPDLVNALRYVEMVKGWIRPLAHPDRTYAAFSESGFNRGIAETLISLARGAVDSLWRRIRMHSNPTRPMSGGIWSEHVNRFRAARDYLLIVNNETTYEESETARAVDRAGTNLIVIAAATPVVLAVAGAAAPLVVGEASLIAGMTAHGARGVWIWAITNPEAALAVSEFAVGTMLQIDSMGLDEFAESISTPEGAMMMTIDIILLRAQIRGGTSDGGRRRTYDVEVEVETRTPTSARGRVRSIREVSGPSAAPEVTPSPRTTTSTDTEMPTAAPRTASPETEAPPALPPTSAPDVEAPSVAPHRRTPTVEAPPVAPRTSTPHVAEAGTELVPHTSVPALESPPVTPHVTPTDPYAELTLPQLRRRSRTDPEAMEAMRLRYRAMSDGEVRRRARSRGDAMAASELERRTIRDPAASGTGRFSRPDIEDRLRTHLRAARTSSGIPRRARTAVEPDIARTEGGTIGVARTDVEGLEDSAFTGRSVRAGGMPNPDTEFPPTTDREVLPHTHDHAEQDIADQFAAELRGLGLTEDQLRERLRGRTIWMLIEQEPCSSCAEGIGHPELSDAEVGVLMRFSRSFPTLTIQVRDALSSALITLFNGIEQ